MLNWKLSKIMKSVDSLASTFEDGAPAVALPVESESPEQHSERHSTLSDASQQQEARLENVATKESLADWGVVACVFLSNLIAAFDFTGFGVFYPSLVGHFDATTADVGWCSSIIGFVQAVVALFASYPIQSFGCRLPGVVGCLLFFLGISLSCLAPNITTIYFTYGVIAGSGKGLASLSGSIILHQRFSRNRNLASGIGWLGSSFGGIFGSILANQFIQSYSWRGAFLILGALQAQRIPLYLFFRTPKRLILHSNSDASGFSPPRKMSSWVILRYVKEAFNFSICRQTRYFVYATAYILHIFCLMGYAHHTVNRAINVGLSRDQGVAAVSLYNVVSTVTSFLVAFISNLPRVRSSLVFAAAMFSAFLSIVAIYIHPGIVGTMTSAALFGIHLGCTTTVSSVVAVDLMGVALLPKSLAVLQFIGGFARLLSPPFVGWIFDVTHDYNKAFAIIGCMAFVSGTLMVALTVVTKCHPQSVTKDVESSPSKTPTSES